MLSRIIALGVMMGLEACLSAAQAQSLPKKDPFYWLGEINKASLVINSEEGLLDPALAPRIAKGLDAVLKAGAEPSGKRPGLVITFEPLLIQSAGVEATLIHAGRSSQDMLSTVRAAMLRDELLVVAENLHAVMQAVRGLAEQHQQTIVPNYTNGVAAQPNSYGHYLLGHLAGLRRDMERLKQAYTRVDLSPMGTTVLNGTGWPLNRNRMAAYLGFAAKVDNAYDAAQILAAEVPVELGGVCTTIAIHAAAYIQDVMTQYAQPRPWILLREGGGNTYVSSSMPQKRNPGILIETRREASRVVSLGMGRAVAAHNIPPGMNDPKDFHENVELLQATAAMLRTWDKVLKGLAIDRQRALEELNSDWTASQEIADTLMRKYKLPFRVGHHFASNIVDFGKSKNIRPSDFPYLEAARIYKETLHEMGLAESPLPMSEAEFRSTLDPTAIVNARVTSGGPQPAEMRRMLADAEEELRGHGVWIVAKRKAIDDAIATLDRDFGKVLAKSN
ncbi:MAG: argininosuccinate lyase [Hyphomicrobiales bacterium]|nr:MAG: argininosuccinate lyase [Hyphomicrobiales bacterium]